MKKILALVIAALMLVSMTAALAAPADVTLTVTDAVAGHEYYYFQLLVGDLNDAHTMLSNVKWGADVADSITYNGTTINPTAGEVVPEAFLTYLSGLTGEDEAVANTISAMVKGNGTLIPDGGATVKTGYYVVKDAYTDPTAEQTTTLSTNVVRIVESTAITPKAGTTEHKKEVLDINDSTDVALDLSNLQNVADGWDKSADHDFGDHVPFKLTTKIASDFAKYDSYYLAVNDTLKDGLILDQTSIKVYVDGKLATQGDGEGEYKLTKDEKTFKVVFEKLNGNANAAAGKEVVVYYTATLDAATAKIGEPGNWNESYAEFSNNPNGNQEGTGKTPKDTAVVFTYKTDVDKVNKEKQPLVGAEFTLTKALQDGTNVTIAVVKFTKDGAVTTKVADGTSSSEGDATKFSFKGLDDGIYTLTETVTPDGYNTIDPVTFRIVATHSRPTKETGDIETLEVKNSDGSEFTGKLEFTKSADTGTLATSVVNNQGTTLPSTGGIGTTIFYIAGSILVLAAVIFLVTKRRMGSEE